MPAPDASYLIDAWEEGDRASPAQRALLLLGTMRPESRDELAIMPLGWIAGQLLRLRAALLGPTLVCLTNCRQCDGVLETSVDIADLTALAALDPAAALGPRSMRIEQDGYLVDFRLPSCADLLRLQGELPSAAERLAHDLIERAVKGDAALAPADLPAACHAAIERAVLEHDPLAQIELSLGCPSCGFQGLEILQAIDFVWAEVAAWAQRLIGDVARLAQAFGWREADILQMSAQRRRRYLDLLPS